MLRMLRSMARLRRSASGVRPRSVPLEEDAEVCSWRVMREVYAAQAARGIPEAIRGLERIDQGRWPTSGRPRET